MVRAGAREGEGVRGALHLTTMLTLLVLDKYIAKRRQARLWPTRSTKGCRGGCDQDIRIVDADDGW